MNNNHLFSASSVKRVLNNSLYVQLQCSWSGAKSKRLVLLSTPCVRCGSLSLVGCSGRVVFLSLRSEVILNFKVRI